MCAQFVMLCRRIELLTKPSVAVDGITTLQGIADELNRRGIPTSAGRGEWQPAQVQRVLQRIAASAGQSTARRCTGCRSAPPKRLSQASRGALSRVRLGRRLDAVEEASDRDGELSGS
jgi:hypothetical protein